MSANKLDYQIKSIIICDDARREDNGKEILIGVYNDQLLVNTVPVMMPRLHFRVSLKLGSAFKGAPFYFSVIGPKGEQVLNATNQVPVPENPGLQTILNIGASPLMLKEFGTYVMKFGMGGKDKEAEVGEFVLRMPQSDAERKRLTK